MLAVCLELNHYISGPTPKLAPMSSAARRQPFQSRRQPFQSVGRGRLRRPASPGCRIYVDPLQRLRDACVCFYIYDNLRPGRGRSPAPALCVRVWVHT